METVFATVVYVCEPIDLTADGTELQRRHVTSRLQSRRVCEALRVSAVLDAQEAEADLVAEAGVHGIAGCDLGLHTWASIGVVDTGQGSGVSAKRRKLSVTVHVEGLGRCRDDFAGSVATGTGDEVYLSVAGTEWVGRRVTSSVSTWPPMAGAALLSRLVRQICQEVVGG